MPILHVAESFAGGVLHAIHDYVRNAPEYEHHLIYAPRSDAPLSARDLMGIASTRELPDGLRARIAMIRDTRRVLGRRAIVHAHSSYAGAYVRLALRRSPDTRIVYTPHCLAFERRDLSRPARAAYWLAERTLAINTSAIAACSPREAALASWGRSQGDVTYVPNVMPFEPRDRVQRESCLTVIGAGRNAAQKDPQFFADCIRAIRAQHPVNAVWVGGDAQLADQFAALDIRVTGWLPRDEALAEYDAADVIVHSAKWEGFPIAILEASALGLPVLARGIPAYEGIGLPFTFGSPSELAGRWNEYATSESRTRLVQLQRDALRDCTSEEQRRALRTVYGGAGA